MAPPSPKFRFADRVFDKAAKIIITAAIVRCGQRAAGRAFRAFSKATAFSLLLWGFNANGVWSATLQGGPQKNFAPDSR